MRLRIEEAIHLAEKGTAGEIRVHAESLCKEDVLDHAAFIFAQLEMNKTEARNGVLLYLSLQDRKVAIIGDIGINGLIGNEYWKDSLRLLTDTIREKGIEHGIITTVFHIGFKIKELFPIQENDLNELPNTVTIGNKDIYKKKKK